MRAEQGFQQPPYPTEHPYAADTVLPSLLKRILPETTHRALEADLERLGNILINEIRPLSPLVHAATLTQYDEFGRRVDRLHTSEGWRKLEDFAIREGYNAIAYEREHGEHSRTYQFARTMIMTGDCHVIMCPLGMTDGATRLLELYGTEAMKTGIFPLLLRRDPTTAYLSGQWMTERPGGSDVSRTETHATPTQRIDTDLGAPYILDGFKWFSSAAEGNIAIALARTGDPSLGSRSLSLFLVPLRLGSYSSPLSNGVLMHRLKNKVGTHGVPTAELELRGTRAWLIGDEGQGVRTIAAMLNITRVHSAVHSVGSLQRCLAIASAYAKVRAVEGGKKFLSDVPLHVAGLADIALLYRALVHVVFGAVTLLGKNECGRASVEEEARLRLLTPRIKAYAAQKASGAMEEAMTALGGLGYMEETGVGRLIRDAMVEKIWEGTVNVCALDLIRATTRYPKAIGYFVDWAGGLIASVPPALEKQLSQAINMLSVSVGQITASFEEGAANPLMPRLILNYFATIACGLYLLEHAIWSFVDGQPTAEEDIEAARRWIVEGELMKLIADIDSVRGEHLRRADLNLKLVYGTSFQGSAKL
ncbi:acyl-CoA dehydrogenase NM domain-like protein [Trametes meyenii]|nr:acyl-CoA dehydrogenase NM domain-like protein [Trametes meyenii]